ncbi:MAG: PKD domain-containing protein, partial [Candidatus Diapherotrites archaeon]|nr:PKD domain-containing protein [Candidatus Diapherotrites archaeon]
MYKKCAGFLFFTIFLALFSANIFAESQPVIHSLIGTPNEIKSGQFVSFSVIATDPEGEELSYDWDFGDGTIGEGLNPKHVFTLPDKKTSETYKTKLTVKNSSGLSSSKTIDIKISEADFTIDIVQPDSQSLLEKTQKISLKTRLLDNKGVVIPDAKVTTVEAKLGDQAKYIELRKIEDNAFGTDIAIGPEIGDVEYLFLRASANVSESIKTTQTAVLLKFKKPPIEAKITIIPREIFPNSKIDLVRIELKYPDGKPVKKAEIKATLNGTPLEFKEFDTFYEAKNVGYVVKEDKIAVEVSEAKDSFGNLLKNFKQEFEIVGSDIDFKVGFEHPKEADSIAPGQKISFIAKIEYNFPTDAQNTAIELIGNEGLKLTDFKYDEELKKFIAEYTVPVNIDYGKELNFKLRATTKKDGQTKKSNNSINLIVSNKFVMKILQATEKEIRIELLYPTQIEKVEAEEVSATLKVKDIEYALKFRKQADGSFSAPLSFTLPSGNQEIKLSLGPEYGFAEQSQTINVESSLAKSFLTIGITIIALAVVLGIGAFAFLRMKKKPVEKPRETTIW